MALLVQAAQAASDVTTDPTNVNYGSISAGASKLVPITVSNSGDTDLTISSVSISGTNPGQFHESDDCSSPIAPGASCQIDATFAPTAAGSYSAQVSIDNNSPAGTVTVPLLGTAIDAVTITPGSLDFGSIGAGSTSAAKPLTVHYDPDASGALHISGVAFGGANPSQFVETDTCGTLQPGDTCQVNVSFKPNAVGSFSATAIVQDDSPDGPHSATVSGDAFDPVSVSPASIAFGTVKVGDVKTSDVTVKNLGADSFNVTGVLVNGGDFSVKPGDNGCAGNTLVQNETCSITVTYAPSSAGPANGTLTVNTDSVVAPKTVDLSGTGGQGGVSFNPASGLDFTEVPVGDISTPQTIQVNNDGNSALVVSSVALNPNPAGQFAITGGTCVGGATVAPSAFCTVTITFSPNAGGVVNGSLIVNSDAPSSPDSAPLTGTGAVPGILPSPNPVAFTTLQQDGTVSLPKTVTIKNTGHAPLVLGVISIGGVNPGSFVKSNDLCSSSTLPVNATCTVNVRFSPVGRGAKSGTLHVPNNTGNGPADVVLSGTSRAPGEVQGLRGSVGCFTARMTWSAPDGPQFQSVLVVRNSSHVPQGPGDGTVVEHVSGQMVDGGRTQFVTYNYRVFGVFTSWNSTRKVYSVGLVRSLRTQRICAPMYNAQITDLSPAVDWTPVTGTSYALRLNHSGVSILVRYMKTSAYQIPASWSYGGSTRHLSHNTGYNLYVYVYNSTYPRGHLIGSSSFFER